MWPRVYSMGEVMVALVCQLNTLQGQRQGGSDINTQRRWKQNVQNMRLASKSTGEDYDKHKKVMDIFCPSTQKVNSLKNENKKPARDGRQKLMWCCWGLGHLRQEGCEAP